MRFYRLLLAIYVPQGGFRDFYGLEKKVTLWCSDGVDAHCFSVVLCSFFITVYPHVCMCTEMFQSATLAQRGWRSFLYYAWFKIHIWVKRDKPNNNSRQTIENTHWDNCFCSPLFLPERKQGLLFKCCGSLSPISCLYYLIIRSFYDELSIEMNFTISLWWGDGLPGLLGNSVCCNAIVLLFLCKYLNKEKLSLALRAFLCWLRHALFTPFYI